MRPPGTDNGTDALIGVLTQRIRLTLLPIDTSAEKPLLQSVIHGNDPQWDIVIAVESGFRFAKVLAEQSVDVFRGVDLDIETLKKALDPLNGSVCVLKGKRILDYFVVEQLAHHQVSANAKGTIDWRWINSATAILFISPRLPQFLQ
jgi:hypothetical protein